jgi:hypothetical protein
MSNKRFNFLLTEEELSILKKKSKKEKRSASNFIKFKCELFNEDKK